MRGIFAGLVVLIAMMFAPTAFATNDPPGRDPCSHGATGKACKPDPQPDKGKDCEAHGNHGGKNEDHCAPGPTQPPVTPPGCGTTCPPIPPVVPPTPCNVCTPTTPPVPPSCNTCTTTTNPPTGTTDKKTPMANPVPKVKPKAKKPKKQRVPQKPKVKKPRPAPKPKAKTTARKYHKIGKITCHISKVPYKGKCVTGVMGSG